MAEKFLSIFMECLTGCWMVFGALGAALAGAIVAFAPFWVPYVLYLWWKKRKKKQAAEHERTVRALRGDDEHGWS